jgi:shikimate dehydrogenase
MFSIDKDTSLYCSFAEKAGSKGCKFHNTGFQTLGINAIYKSFSVTNIEQAMFSMEFLNIKGAGITMPFKKEVLMYVHSVTQDAQVIGAANTVVNEDGELVAYNTDWLAAKEFLQGNYSSSYELYVLGNGGYAAAVRYAAAHLGFKVRTITRSNWDTIPDINDSIVFNCTPVENIQLGRDVGFVDCVVTSHTGAYLATLQAKHQFLLYTGQAYPDIVEDTTQPAAAQK